MTPWIMCSDTWRCWRQGWAGAGGVLDAEGPDPAGQSTTSGLSRGGGGLGCGQVTVKAEVLVAVPAGVVIVTEPLVAPAGTVVTTWVAVSETMLAGVPLKATSVALGRLSPVIVTWSVGAPEVGLRPVMAGVTPVVIRPM